MTAIIHDSRLEEMLIQQRKATGADRYDEVWEGVYRMGPPANDEHQQIVADLVCVLGDVVRWPGLGQVRAGVNLSDRAEDWEYDFRCPDVAVFLHGSAARNLGTHWVGPADFLVEVPPAQGRVGLPEVTLYNEWEYLILRHRRVAATEWNRLSDVVPKVAISQNGGTLGTTRFWVVKRPGSHSRRSKDRPVSQPLFGGGESPGVAGANTSLSKSSGAASREFGGSRPGGTYVRMSIYRSHCCQCGARCQADFWIQGRKRLRALELLHRRSASKARHAVRHRP